MNPLKLCLCAAAILPLSPAQATDFIVDAMANSSSGGVPLSTIFLNAGQTVTVTASTNDLWSAGALPRFSDANGLVAVRFASALDDSGQVPGTQIGADFGLWTQDGFSAPFGSLVGRVGTQYQILGTNFTGSFANAGTLELFYWDSNNGDNFGTITAHISTVDSGVPEPATWAMMLIGFGAIGLRIRHRSRATRAAMI